MEIVINKDIKKEMKKLIILIALLLLPTLCFARSIMAFRVESSYNNKIFFIGGKKYEAKASCLNVNEDDSVYFLERTPKNAPVTADCVTATFKDVATGTVCECWCNDGTYTVERVIDGDTLKLSNGETVCLIGIDCPESKLNDKAQRDSEITGKDLATINKMGQEATKFLKELVKGREVRLEYDVEKRDKYGRLLAYVYRDDTLSKEALGRMTPMPESYFTEDFGTYSFFINATIVKAGYASPMTIYPNIKYIDLFRKLYEEARENKRGRWR